MTATKPSKSVRKPSASPAAAPKRRRGRPPKFGRPSQMIALTLPDEVLEALRSMHPDPGWAIVQLVEANLQGGAQPRRPATVDVAQLAHLPGRRALIVVRAEAFSSLEGVSTIPLSDGRAFLAFDTAGGIAALELAILDRLDALPSKSGERTTLARMREIVRAWRRDRTLTFRTKSILVAESTTHDERRPPLGQLQTVPDSGPVKD